LKTLKKKLRKHSHSKWHLKHVHMYVNAKLIPVETIPEIGEEG
jgi:hypothetical protein